MGGSGIYRAVTLDTKQTTSRYSEAMRQKKNAGPALDRGGSRVNTPGLTKRHQTPRTAATFGVLTELEG